jgi:hypothetical protein
MKLVKFSRNASAAVAGLLVDDKVVAISDIVLDIS